MTISDPHVRVYAPIGYVESKLAQGTAGCSLGALACLVEEEVQV